MVLSTLMKLGFSGCCDKKQVSILKFKIFLTKKEKQVLSKKQRGTGNEGPGVLPDSKV